MREVFIVSDNIISPLAGNTAENFAMLQQGVTAIREHMNLSMSDQPFYAALLASPVPGLRDEPGFTKFEQLLISSIEGALLNSPVSLADGRSILVISSTKGNISLLETSPPDAALKKRIALHTSAKMVGGYFKCVNPPVVISNACISGSLALLMARRLIQSGEYDHAVVVGADTISKFVLSGFQSFQAISPVACKPFDASRSGINLGEGAGTIVVSADPAFSAGVTLAGGATSNDANHISGPSRTGEELASAVHMALKDAGLSPDDIGFISAHGTATLYNDEMEAQAINLANLQHTPVNSLKGYYGHTLGAAGLIESIISIHSLRAGLVVGSKGFEEKGVSKPINISNEIQHREMQHCLKTASGFGGCNAAIIFSKHSSLN
jgi:3-oxoacyl-[acyl-carrier-protein] synthase-1